MVLTALLRIQPLACVCPLLAASVTAFWPSLSGVSISDLIGAPFSNRRRTTDMLPASEAEDRADRPGDKEQGGVNEGRTEGMEDMRCHRDLRNKDRETAEEKTRSE